MPHAVMRYCVMPRAAMRYMVGLKGKEIREREGETLPEQFYP